jgi:CBS domain-containing protein
MSVGRICIREVDTALEVESAQEAAQRMHDRKVGTLVVVDELERPIGILTDRDLAVRVVARGADPYVVTVSELMTRLPRTVNQNAPIEAALASMRAGACRRLPVVDDKGKLVGLVSLDDILNLIAEEFRQVGKLLSEESPSSLVVEGARLRR